MSETNPRAALTNAVVFSGWTEQTEIAVLLSFIESLQLGPAFCKWVESILVEELRADGGGT